ncbi:FHA domain-containing protein [Catellatospora sp. KI3]|uniref:FHA domain-containing protein n=1 Tax=Catellatospora sp. KI3 TaxID=3041620 RepID=UPI002482EE4A|nr:FHA domain-containing protein [Catellatospora sp. KI3]MDI1460107.1 FHA domain-containing protein [Catellatospora sp. KI3]
MHLRRDYPYCLHCGTLRKGAKVEAFAAPELRWRTPDGQTRTVELVKPVTTIGRGADNDVVLDDGSVSRAHARVTRTPHGFEIEDLNSFNGTTVAGHTMHGNAMLLTDEIELYVGDVPVRFAQPRSAAIGSKTMVAGVEHSMLLPPQSGQPMLPELAPTAGGPLSARPKRRSGWALKQVPDVRGDQQWVLRNTRTGQYLQLDERDVFLWHQLDGENTVRDLLFAYAQEFGELALPRIERTLRTFAALELVRGVHGQQEPEKPRLLKRIGRAVLNALLRMEVSIRGLDGFFGRLYRAFGWRFFTRTGVALLWAVIAVGLYATVVASADQNLFDLQGAGVGGAIAVGLGYLLALVVHESAHALAVKSYGRTVTRGGFMLMMGMPFAFVDTSDMWFGSRWSRIVVTLSGPLSTAAIAGMCAMTAAWLPEPHVAGVAYQLAFGLYLNTLYNLNPLMPLDGYQALADGLRLPRLREEAAAYFTRGIWADLKAGRRPGLRQVGMAAYGFAAVAGTGLFVLLGFLAWRDRLGGLVEEYLPPGIDVVVIVLLIGLIMFPVWYRLLRKLVGFIKSRRGATPAEASA